RPGDTDVRRDVGRRPPAAGAWLNPGWGGAGARRRIDQLGLDPKQRAGRLSGGQRAQLALTLAIAKRPELPVLDEPGASLDPATSRSSRPATPTGRARSSCVRPARSWTRRGPSNRSAWRTWCSPT